MGSVERSRALEPGLAWDERALVPAGLGALTGGVLHRGRGWRKDNTIVHIPRS